MPPLTKDQKDKITGIIHLTFTFSLPLAAILLNNHVADIIFMYYFTGLYLSWIYLDGECLVTLIFKKMNDQTYKIGESAHKMDDIFSIINESAYTYILLPILMFLYGFATYMIFSRHPNLLPMGFVYVLFAVQIAYTISLRQEESYAKQGIKEVFKVLNIVILTLVTRNLLS